jgi:hypothetical protein
VGLDDLARHGRFLRFMRSASKTPGLDEATMAVRRDAENLPDEVSDDEAADLLRRSHKRPALRRAYESVLDEGLYRDLSMQNYVYRVLHLAVTGEALPMPSPGDEARFEAVDGFAELSPDAAWADLTTRVPELADLLSLVTSGGEVSLADERLAALVGAESPTTDPIVGSHYAEQFARNWLQRAAHLR